MACVVVLVRSVLLQDEAKGENQTPVVINMDGADIERQQQQLQLIDEQVTTVRLSSVMCSVLGWLLEKVTLTKK